MSKLKVGECLTDFTYETPFDKGLSISDKAAEKSKTALVFLRYAGCTVCQYEIHQLAVNYKNIAGDDGQLLVVLQSEPESIAQQLKPDSLPFDIVCDPQQTLYKKFDIAYADSEESLMTQEEYDGIAAEVEQFEHGKYEGSELQLPAVFIIDEQLKLLYVHYGKSIVDIPSVEEFQNLMK